MMMRRTHEIYGEMPRSRISRTTPQAPLMDNWGGLQATRKEAAGHGYRFITKITPERRAMFVSLRLTGLNSTWAAFYAFRLGEQAVVDYATINGGSLDERWVLLWWNTNRCTLVPQELLDQLEE
jgi:hypothetical protein